jgi:hypothetical protein
MLRYWFNCEIVGILEAIRSGPRLETSMVDGPRIRPRPPGQRRSNFGSGVPRKPRRSGLHPPEGRALRASTQHSKLRSSASRVLSSKWLIAILSFAVGILSGYLTDLAKLAIPPGAIVDVASGDAIRATILLEHDQGDQGELWLYPFPLSANRPDIAQTLSRKVSDFDDLHRQLYASGAIDVNITHAKLVVEGQRNTGVRIIGMQAMIKNRINPTPGFTLITPGPQGEGLNARVGFDLDNRQNTVARETRGPNAYADDYFGTPVFSNSTFFLSKGEQQIFQVTARTVKYDVQWTIDLTALVDGVTKHYEATVAGRPIRTSTLIRPARQAYTTANAMDWDSSKYSEIYEYSFDQGNFDRTH